jgi:hypothetical protein
MKRIGGLFLAGLFLFAALQFVRPDIPAQPATAEINVPQGVRQILEKDCYSCHSDQRRLSWFDQIVPGYWLVRHDVLTARGHLDFSTLGSKPAPVQRATLYEAVSMIQLGAMPLPSFLKLHPESKATPEELAALKTYLAPWSNAAGEAAIAQASDPKERTAARPSLAGTPPELNGFPFDPSFESWKLLSTTDRGDNHTFRVILGNDVAVKAAQKGKVSPWPDDARFAKIAWQKELGADGLVHPGKFIQVELMQKGEQRYEDTEGWGWGRWRGAELKPYGNDAHFVNECTSCHLPVKGNDYVYTQPISDAKVRGREVLNNNATESSAALPYQPLGWNVITMFVDPQTRTTAILFGNVAAMQAVKTWRVTSGSSAKDPTYGAGAVLSLVTWAQREDPHWFGARIPDVPQSVEFVQFDAAGRQSYRRFAGGGLAENQITADRATRRAKYLEALAPASLP